MLTDVLEVFPVFSPVCCSCVARVEVKFNLSVLLSELHVIVQVYFRHPHPNFIPCNALMHEGSCLECAVKDFFGTFYLFLKVYLTVYSMPLLLFRTKRLFTAPKESLRTLIENTCVSSLFFAVDATLIKYGLCLLRNAWGRPPPTPALIPVLAGAMGVVGMLIERQSRRLEMLYYGLPQVK